MKLGRKGWIIFFLGIILGCLADADAQVSILKKPRGYVVPDGNLISHRSKRLTNDIRQSAWSVMADSSNRGIFMDKKCKKKIRVSENFEAFYVVKESKKSLQIARYSDTIPLNGQLSKSKVIGWMRKTDLILWDAGLCDPVSGVMKKLYPIQTIGYKNIPDPSIHLWTSEKKLDSSRFYFLVKKRGKKILVARNGFFSADFKEAIMGWFPAEQFAEIGLPTGFLFTSTEPLDTFLKARNISLEISSSEKGRLYQNAFILINGKNLLFPNCHFSTDTNSQKSNINTSVSMEDNYFLSSTSKIASFRGLELKNRFIEQRGVSFKAVVIPKAIISEMNELYIKQVRAFDVSARKELSEGLKNTFSRLSFGLSKSTFSYKIGLLKLYFGSRLVIPSNMEKRTFDDVLSSKKIKDGDLQFFIKNLDEVFNQEKDIFNSYYSFFQENNILKYFPINLFD